MQATLAQVLMEVRELKTLKYSHDSKPNKAISGEHQPPFISYHHQGQPSVPQAAQTALSNLGNSYTGDLGYAEGRTSGVGVWGTWGGSSAVREGVRGRGLQGNRGGGIRGDRRRLRQGSPERANNGLKIETVLADLDGDSCLAAGGMDWREASRAEEHRLEEEAKALHRALMVAKHEAETLSPKP